MTASNSYAKYECHYARMLNAPPDWRAALARPDAYAERKPWLPDDKAARILDFGCGLGNQLLGLWCAGFRNLEGVELTPAQAAVCRELAPAEIQITCMDGRDYLRGKEGVFGLIILNDVLEHVPPEAAPGLLRQIHAALRPGGTLAVRVPNMASLLSAYSRYVDITHLTGFTEISLLQLTEQAGFNEGRFVPELLGWQPGSWRPWAPWRGLGLRGLLNLWLHRCLYALRGQNPRPTRFGYNLELYCKKGVSS